MRTETGQPEPDPAELPDLRSIQDPRHPGVTEALCHTYAEAAEVCLSRHHPPPQTSLDVECLGKRSVRLLSWSQPTPTAMRSHGNRDDATRDGAYAVSLAVVERELGMVALCRADIRTGADWYVGRPGAPDLEEAHRLEVSGLDGGDVSEIRRRLRAKEAQVSDGQSYLPAFASVVGFRVGLVLLSRVAEPPNE